jgi:hypothetical protein
MVLRGEVEAVLESMVGDGDEAIISVSRIHQTRLRSILGLEIV